MKLDAVVEVAKAKAAQLWAKSKAVGMALAFGMSLTLPAGATDGSGSSADMTAVIGSTDNVVTMVGKVWTLMLSNPLLTTYVGCSMLSIGIGFFLYLKKAARH